MFSCMMGCIARDWRWLLGRTLLGITIGAVISPISFTLTGSFSWSAVFFGAFAGTFIGFIWAVFITASGCSRACRS